MPRPTAGLTPVFHMLPVEKLASVVEHGLLCDSEAARRFEPVAHLSAAHPAIKERRRRIAVPLAQRGYMADYVPFYFGPRSPMLFTIACGNTAYGSSGRGQEGIVHLVLQLEQLVRDFAGSWCFIDAHFSRAWATFGDSLEQIDERVDFSIIRARQWAGDERSARRQAELLVHHVVPWSYVQGVVVMTQQTREQVDAVLDAGQGNPGPAVHVRPPGSYPGTPFPHGYYYTPRVGGEAQ